MAVIKSILLAVFVLVASLSNAHAADEIYTGTFSDQAISGYDAVAYFKQGKPVKGSKEFSYDYKGAQWLFSSVENLEKFKAAPDMYAPQYGGYCAYAVAKGKTASADPEAFAIVKGKLYLNYDKEVQKLWEEDRTGYITSADANWPKVLE